LEAGSPDTAVATCRMSNEGSRASRTKFGRLTKAKDVEHIATANRMRSDGFTVKDIAKYLGVSRATLYRYLSEHGAA
jgi:DNA invertase Pin-like site-specific DNA recombinase